MSAIDNARAALGHYDELRAQGWWQAGVTNELGESIRDLIAEHARLTSTGVDSTLFERATRLVQELREETLPWDGRPANRAIGALEVLITEIARLQRCAPTPTDHADGSK